MAFKPVMVAFTLIPAATMLIGSFATCVAKPSQWVEARIQRFNAGLLLGAVMVGIFPLLAERLGMSSGEVDVKPADVVSALVGFVLSLTLMFGMRLLELSEDAEEVKEVAGAEKKIGADEENQLSDKVSDFKNAAASPTVKENGCEKIQANKDAAAIPEHAVPAKVHFPWSFIFAVTVDAAVDGILIGMTGAIEESTGWLLTIAGTLEMGFLGFTYGQAVFKASRGPLALALVALPPACLFGLGLGAEAGAAGLQDSCAFPGIMSFAIVALMFLALEELLAEASEVEGGDRWHISGWLYVGVVLSVVLETVL